MSPWEFASSPTHGPANEPHRAIAAVPTPASHRSPVPRSRALWPVAPASRRGRLTAIRQGLLVAKKWDYSQRRPSPGRPRVEQKIVALVLRFARQNLSWGYDRIQGALANLGQRVSDQTVGNILKEHGLEPAPERKRQSTWKTFLQSPWDVLAAIDVTTLEVWTKGGLVTYYLLFVMELATRRVHFAGCTPNPKESWMKQVAREWTNFEDGFLNGKRYLLLEVEWYGCDYTCPPCHSAALSQTVLDIALFGNNRQHDVRGSLGIVADRLLGNHVRGL